MDISWESSQCSSHEELVATFASLGDLLRLHRSMASQETNDPGVLSRDCLLWTFQTHAHQRHTNVWFDAWPNEPLQINAVFGHELLLAPPAIEETPKVAEPRSCIKQKRHCGSKKPFSKNTCNSSKVHYIFWKGDPGSFQVQIHGAGGGGGEGQTPTVEREYQQYTLDRLTIQQCPQERLNEGEWAAFHTQ